MILGFLVYILLIFIFGWLMVGFLARKITIEEHVGLSFLIGFGVHSIIYFIILRLFFYTSNSLLLLVAETIILLIVSLVAKTTTRHVEISKAESKNKYLSILLTLFSSVILLYIFAQAIYWPISTPDAIYLYDFRAQRLLQGDIITFFRGTSFYLNYLYPPFTSLMHLFIYQVGNVNPQIIYPTTLTAFYLVIVGYVKRITKSNLLGSLTGALILLTPSVLWNSFIAINNIIFMVYLSLACLYLFDEDGSRVKNSNVLIGILLLGLSPWVRIEPFWIVPLGVFGIKSLFKKDIMTLFVAVAVVLSMSYLWPKSIVRYNVASNTVGVQLSPAKVVEQVKVAVGQNKRFGLANNINAVQYFLGPLYQSWGLVLPLFVAVIIAEMIVFRKIPTWIEIVALLLSVSIILGIVDFSHRYAQWRELNDSVYRMATITIPIFWVGITTSKVWRRFFEGTIS